MKSSKCLGIRWAVVFFVWTVVVALLSWVGSIYGWPSVQSLLSEDGVRWELRHILSNYVQTPALGIVLVMCMGLGIGIKAGLYNACRRFLRSGKQLSGKERRAFVLSMLVLLGYFIIVLFSIPHLKSVTGSILHSPFWDGFFYILSFGLGLSGMVYGYASNTYRNTNDIVDGMSGLLSRHAGYFVTLFMVVQFFSVLDYTCLLEGLGISDTGWNLAFQLCCYLPLVEGKVRGMGL